MQCYRRLPLEVRETARKNFRLWQADPRHPSLHFKRVRSVQPLFSVRVGIGWRALALVEDDAAVWFWIGPHAEYDRLLDAL